MVGCCPTLNTPAAEKPHRPPHCVRILLCFLLVAEAEEIYFSHETGILIGGLTIVLSGRHVIRRFYWLVVVLEQPRSGVTKVVLVRYVRT